jgi:hypothetical protein
LGEFRYGEHLIAASKYAVKKSMAVGLGMGAFQLVLYVDYAISVW